MSSSLKKRKVVPLTAPSVGPSVSSSVWLLPNILTLWRLSVVPFVVTLVFVPQSWAFYVQMILFSTAALTDFLDGYFARRYGQVSRLGRLLDPLADKLLVVPVLVALIAKGSIHGGHLLPALLLITRELVTPALRERYMEMRHVALSVHPLAQWKTAFEMLAIVGLLGGMGPHMSSTLKIFGLVCLWSAAILGLVTVVFYINKIFQRV